MSPYEQLGVAMTKRPMTNVTYDTSPFLTA
jgi:hypothetical protein